MLKTRQKCNNVIHEYLQTPGVQLQVLQGIVHMEILHFWRCFQVPCQRRTTNNTSSNNSSTTSRIIKLLFNKRLVFIKVRFVSFWKNININDQHGQCFKDWIDFQWEYPVREWEFWLFTSVTFQTSDAQRLFFSQNLYSPTLKSTTRVINVLSHCPYMGS